MRMVKIYALRDPDTMEIRYIGKTVAKYLCNRLSTHCADARRHRQSHAQRWIGSLLDMGRRPEIVLLDKVAECDWQQAEREYIVLARACGLPLTNHQEGGISSGPRKVNSKAISERMKGNQYARGAQSAETRAKKSAAHKGKTNNPGLGGWNAGKKLVIIDGKRSYV